MKRGANNKDGHGAGAGPHGWTVDAALQFAALVDAALQFAALVDAALQFAALMDSALQFAAFVDAALQFAAWSRRASFSEILRKLPCLQPGGKLNLSVTDVQWIKSLDATAS